MYVDGLRIEKQKWSKTCGYAAASMIIKYLIGTNIDEFYLLEKEPFDGKGITFSNLLDIYKKYLTGYDASLIQEDKERTLEIIKKSLQEKLPLQVLRLTENLLGNKEPVLHYAVLIGYDEAMEDFILADPYGFNTVIYKEDFFYDVKRAIPSYAMIRFSKHANNTVPIHGKKLYYNL